MKKSWHSGVACEKASETKTGKIKPDEVNNYGK